MIEIDCPFCKGEIEVYAIEAPTKDKVIRCKNCLTKFIIPFDVYKQRFL